jgi:hypothetical protein
MEVAAHPCSEAFIFRGERWALGRFEGFFPSAATFQMRAGLAKFFRFIRNVVNVYRLGKEDWPDVNLF